ncbi:hypothetical protein GJ25_gp045 [Mycobacterium phage Hawkeye]|uniref:Uncharacterized protein n=1 Tax=Mycobacterium phage Hawkeye TaxID=1458711 RepID=X2KSN0_9CAUD|nr:hypothetical protein GJ25_gp045 [Mycobacterium phage Hawkeye]AHN84056.1 hypothetical protein PBI_HAWKEYE_45 [Mycobacterium phage Hawkeye]
MTTIHPASAKQVKYVADLLATKDWANDYRTKGVSRAATLRLMITWAMESDKSSNNGPLVPVDVRNIMTSDHLGERVNQGLAYVLENCGAAEGYEYCYQPFTSQGASALIDWLKPMAEKAADKVRVVTGAGSMQRDGEYATQVEKVDEPVELEAGMYKVDDTFYKVQKAVHGSGKMYAKKASIIGVDGNGVPVSIGAADPHHFEVSFAYAPGAIKDIRPDHKLSYEDAKEFGVLYGTCVCCGRTLTDELSIALGIGPICGGRQFGGEFKQLVKDTRKLLKEGSKN